ncbi:MULTISPECIES: serine hydrolase domain-containing protein [Streptomycetaceae]|uniref:Putative peptidase n=1 Tax=Streptantibioticus cattleyicolor (strain ATCC 35852 / DSM 46488 / JCM 4925 / NBRC 14057 / NRRL 8057) TaxID=1003195 RepID=F8JSY9_STREN|nr:MULTISPECIES: serine hydrolase domain-containing protein [Streptomycetaceae]AEW98007.1 putative peptidase [Streptantibioticus cattleyicolor NRRL 8057 = DSM 46488]MYS62407.1 serine hydrolase [Streptomyces sp. SID5468]CCB78325.1 putative beta-lactamase [Streptantibioticus cattleyicolor NRRL 8057 = DSM 46488]
MNTRTRAPRCTALAVVTMAAAVTAGAIVPASAALAARPAAATASHALPELDPAALRHVLSGLPNDDITGALVRITGRAGQWSGTAGEGDIATGARVDRSGRFRIGSVSKIFTATVLLQLAGEGRLDLHATVQHYLPGLLPAGYPPIEVGQLLNHTSGLPGRGGERLWGDGTTRWFADHRLDSWTPRQVVAELVQGTPMDFAPGHAQEYNGLNTFIAGLVAERVTGRPFAREVHDRITGPLGLRDTYLPEVTDARLPRPAAHGYLTVPEGTSHLTDVTEQSAWPWAEGGMISSAPDLDHFVTALFSGRLLRPAQQRLLFTVPDLPNFDNHNCETGGAHRACLSMGLMRHTFPDGTVVWGKTGSRPGFTDGVFATRDLSRRLVYCVNPTGLTGAETPYVLRLVSTVFTK